jgi:hypothetical protein
VRGCVVSASRSTNGRSAAEGGPKQLVDHAPRVGSRQAVLELDLDESHQERVERPAGREQLLSDLGKWSAGRDHRRERCHQTAGALDVPDGGAAIRIPDRAHGDTNAAPVIPAAA